MSKNISKLKTPNLNVSFNGKIVEIKKEKLSKNWRLLYIDILYGDKRYAVELSESRSTNFGLIDKILFGLFELNKTYNFVCSIKQSHNNSTKILIKNINDV